MKKKYKIIASAACICALVFSDKVNAQWTAVGTGISSGVIYAMAPAGTTLYVGGGYFSPFTDIAIWNGSSYVNAGVAPPQPIQAITTFDSVTYFACSQAIYQRIGAATTKIATLSDPCYALCFWNHKLYAGGWMDSVNHKYTGYIAQYSGGTWSGISVEVDNWVNAMCIYNGQLAVGGYMNYSTAGDTLYGIGLWDGTKWSHFYKGMKGNGVFSLAAWNTDLYMGGSFDSVCSTANGKHLWAKNIAKWSGAGWDSVGKGCSGQVNSLALFNSTMVAGGNFDSIMSWNTTNWTTLGTVANFSGVNVAALAVMGGNLYAGGSIEWYSI